MNAQMLQMWLQFVEAIQPLITAGQVLASDVAALFRKANPNATNEELNAALGAIAAQALAEQDAIAREKADALKGSA